MVLHQAVELLASAWIIVVRRGDRRRALSPAPRHRRPGRSIRSASTPTPHAVHAAWTHATEPADRRGCDGESTPVAIRCDTRTHLGMRLPELHRPLDHR